MTNLKIVLFIFFICFSSNTSKAAPLGSQSRNIIITDANGQVLKTTLTQAGSHLGNIVLKVTTTDDIEYVIDLGLNKFLLSYAYQEKVITKEGEYLTNFDKKRDHCYYIGTVRGHPGSSASVSTCHDIIGYFIADGTTYSISSAQSGYSFNSPQAVVEKLTDDVQNFKCGVYNPPDFKNHTRKKRATSASTFDRAVRIIELYVSSDSSHYSLWNTADEATKRIKSIVNIANGLYNAVNMYLVLVGVEVWTWPRINVTSDYVATLNNWHIYKRTVLNYRAPSHDSSCLFLGSVNISGGVVGLAQMDSMCSSESSGAFIKDSTNLNSAAAILTHEIGHTMGLVHDSSSCSCDDPMGSCIMAASTYASRPATRFSSCSKTDLVEKRSLGLDLCLFNVPITIDTPVCGNGVIEDGEDCDCGNLPQSECNQRCCNSTSCRLSGSAQCAYGLCCNLDTCQIKAAGVICRSLQDYCDLQEVCNGQSPLCPTNTFRHDGVPCFAGSTVAFCYNGKCRSHDTQCQNVWQVGVKSSADTCYTTFNAGGYIMGGCKETPGSIDKLTPCNASNTMCGQLFCGASGYNATLRFKATYHSGACFAAILDFGTQILSPGFVPNGAKCGETQMCLSQECVNVADVIANNSCPSGCPKGVCNNMGVCQCFNGFQYPDCTVVNNQSSTTPTVTMTTTITLPTIPTSLSTILTTTATSIPTTSTTLPTISTALPTISTTLLTISTTPPTISTTLPTISTTLPTFSNRLTTISTTLPNISTDQPPITTTVSTLSTLIPRGTPTTHTQIGTGTPGFITTTSIRSTPTIVIFLTTPVPSVTLPQTPVWTTMPGTPPAKTLRQTPKYLNTPFRDTPPQRITPTRPIT